MAEVLDPNRHTTPLRFFLATNHGQLKWLALNSTLYSAGSLAFTVATYLVGRAVDVISGQSNGNTEQLLIGTIACLVLYEVGYRAGHFCEVLLRTRVRANTKKALFDHTHSLSFGYFADTFAGEVAHKIATTADALEQLVLITSNQIIEGGVLTIFSILLLGWVHLTYGVFVALWSVLLCTGLYFIAQAMDGRAKRYAREEARTTGALVDVYANIAAVKVYGKKNVSTGVYAQIDSETDALRSLEKWDIIMFHYEGWFMVLLGLGLILITSHLYASGSIKIGDILFILATALRLYTTLWELGPQIASFIRFRGEAAQNIHDLVVAPGVVDGDRIAIATKESVRVEYRGVMFGYSREKPVLDDFSITIEPLQKIGIVGLSGAGKTTFANLLLRFFDVQNGSILLNGEDIRDFTQEFVRSHASYISQDTSLFHATVAENIAYGVSAASLADIEHAARLAYADEFIRELPQEYESIVGERGVKLSGGQRQRVAIARAILADRPLFLLDEATSALDSDSEHKIQKGLEALMEGKTVIAIAHRLSTLSRMDRIVFLENGKIAEDGTHEKLLARKGKYAELWNMQAGGFLPDEL